MDGGQQDAEWQTTMMYVGGNSRSTLRKITRIYWKRLVMGPLRGRLTSSYSDTEDDRENVLEENV